MIGAAATDAGRLAEYQSLGIETVLASGYPHLEKTYRVAELLFPHLNLVQPAEHGRTTLRGGPAFLAGGGLPGTDGAPRGVSTS